MSFTSRSMTFQSYHYNGVLSIHRQMIMKRVCSLLRRIPPPAELKSETASTILQCAIEAQYRDNSLSLSVSLFLSNESVASLNMENL